MTGTNRGFLKTRFKGLSKATGEYECAFEVRMCPFVKLRAELATQRAGGESFVFLFFLFFLGKWLPAGLSTLCHQPEVG